MKSEELRALQAPLKAKYKEMPTAVLITLKAQGRTGEGITCKIETGKAMVEAGLHEATGGAEDLAFPKMTLWGFRVYGSFSISILTRAKTNSPLSRN